MRPSGLVTAAVLVSLACPSHAGWEAISQAAQPIFIRGGEPGVWIAAVPYVGHEFESYDRPAVVLLTSAPNLVYCDGRTENRNFAALAGIRFTIERRPTGYVMPETVLHGNTLNITVEFKPPPSWKYDEPLEDVFASSLWCGLLNARQAWPEVQFVEYRVSGSDLAQFANYAGVYSLLDVAPMGQCVKWNREMTASLTGRSVAVTAPAADRSAGDISKPSADSVSSMDVFAPKPPIADADPGDRHKETRNVATRLVVSLVADGLLVGIDSLSTQRIVISVGRNMVVGMKCDLYYYEGAERVPFGPCPTQMEMGLPNSAHLERIKALARKQGALQFVQELAFFETDSPPQHNWQPEQGRYRLLWRGLATGVLEERH